MSAKKKFKKVAMFRKLRKNTCNNFKNELIAIKNDGDENLLMRRLKEMSDHVICKLKPETIRKNRKQFNLLMHSDHGWVKKRFKGLQAREIRKENCFVCTEKSTEIHHIIQIQTGGPPTQLNNLIPICSSCHQKIHPWMSKNLPRIDGVKHASEIIPKEISNLFKT